MPFLHCCPHFQERGAYSFLFWRLPSICSFQKKITTCFHNGEAPAWVDWAGLWANLGDSRACSSDLGSAIFALLLTPLQRHSWFSWSAGPNWAKLIFQDLCGAWFNAWEGISHLHTVLAWPSAEQGSLKLHLYKEKYPGLNRNAFL